MTVLPQGQGLTGQIQQAAAAQPTATVWTRAIWAAAVLAYANVPVSANNISNVMRWMTAENPDTGWAPRNNPLNSSLGTSASDGTAGYPNLLTAAFYTAKMLNQQNMSGIWKALNADASPDVFSAAVVSSPWAESRYGVAAAGAPAQWIVAGRGTNYIATLPTGNPGQTAPQGGNPSTDKNSGGPNLPSFAFQLGSYFAQVIPTNPGQPGAGSQAAGGPPAEGANPEETFGGLVPGLGTILGDLTSASWWKRLGLGAGGVIVIAVGLWIFLGTTGTGSKVEGEVTGAAKTAGTAAVLA